jgi:UDP-N-acetylglucosamine--N-acetylmuramyl-(pentapeptide) pyrophosphoryl-undecaprenol N-acetylglucosamine transferase
MSDRLFFAGGGTGGHLFPAIAIADEVRRVAPGAEVLFIGTKGKIESHVVPNRGYRFVPIWISGFSRSLSCGTMLFPLKVVVSMLQSITLLLKEKPGVVVGTGGYVCGPPVMAASLLGIPTLIQEQNSYPGVTTRLLATRADQVHITFESTRRFLRRSDNVHLTGNPVRALIGTVTRANGAASLGLDPACTTVLVVGGSQGAVSINTAMLAIAPALLQQGVQVIWLTGEREFARVQEQLGTLPAAGELVLRPFLADMQHAFAVADLVVCRSGASTLAELMCAGLPSILVPYPHAAADHQTENARAMVEGGAALLCPDGEIGTRLSTLITELLGNVARRAAMGAAAATMGKPDAARTLANAALTLARSRHDR